MRARTSFAPSPSGHDSLQDSGRQHKRGSIFRQPNKTFISKPPDLPPAPAYPLSVPSASSFTFTAGTSGELPIKNSLAQSKHKEPSPTAPLFNLSSPQYPSDTGRSGSSNSGSRSESMESLASSMANLKVRGNKPTGVSDEEEGALSSAASTPDKSKDTAPTTATVTENLSTDESSQDEPSSESDLSSDEDPTLKNHLALLQRRPDLDELNEIKTAPIFTESVRKYARSLAGTSKDQPFSQYGLLAGDLTGSAGNPAADGRIFWNIAAPSSFFICGSQGSGKSHTLSCLLENALAPCKANVLPRPLTGIVFHYDTFISDSGGSPCEVAWLSSNPNIKVRVLCPPTNIRTMQRIYSRFPHIRVEELRLNESDLNTKRMLDLMAVTAGGNLPLYLHVAQRILRDLRVLQQKTDTGFNYAAFKRTLAAENLTDMQLAPLKQRLDTLESFMVHDHAKAFDMFNNNSRPPQAQASATQSRKKNKPRTASGTSWTPYNGHLTIVDLSCPCVTAEMACSLFHICLSLFLEQDPTGVGRIVALDEAHKYMSSTSSSSSTSGGGGGGGGDESRSCAALTEALLATIRLQRHLGARVIISTQEPTVSPRLLDLCSVTVVHRFTSPDWLGALRRHLAGVSTGGRLLERARRVVGGGGGEEEGEWEEGEEEGGGGVGALTLGDADPGLELFSRIVDLRVGEALMFAPSAIVGVRRRKGGCSAASGVEEVKRLAHGVLKVRIRNRTTADGGRSIMAA